MKKILSLLLLTLIGVVANAQQAIQRGRVTRDASQNQSTTSSTSLAKIKIRLSDDSQIGLTDSAGYFSPSETLFPGDLIFGYRNGEKLFGYKWQDQTDGNNNTPNQGIDLQIIIIGNGLDLMGEVRIRISQGGPFLEEIKPYTFLPFIEGPRMCLGQFLSLLESKVRVCSFRQLELILSLFFNLLWK